MFLCVCVRIFPEVYREVERTAPPAGADRSGLGRPARVEGPCDPGVLSSRTTGWAPPPWGMGSRRRPSLRGPPTLGRAPSPGAESRAASPRRRVPGGESLAPAVRPAGREPHRARPRPPASWRATTSGAAAETPGRNKQPRVSQRERAVKTGAAGRDGSGGPASSALQGPTPETRTPPAPGFPSRSRGGRAHAPSVSCVPLPRAPLPERPTAQGPAAGLRTLRRCPCGTF